MIDMLNQWIKSLSKPSECYAWQQQGIKVREILANELPTELQAKVDSAILNLASSYDSKDI